jgi:transposase InsO family protein
MNITYSTNPHLPKLRARAVELVRLGKSIREVARYFGFNPSTVSRWNRKVPKSGTHAIPTNSSRPHSHPKQLKATVVQRIIELRLILKGRCAEVIHKHLLKEDIKVSLSSVKRTLDRQRLTNKKTKWKKYHYSTERPEAAKPGDLVQIDTVHLMKNESKRIYIYTLLDVCSRWAYALAFEKLSNLNTVKFVRLAEQKAPFNFNCLQSDHGPEFSKLFTKKIKILHRHSRIRKPNDNAHLERFNRTLQDEYVHGVTLNTRSINKGLPDYLKYYNHQRLHLGLNLKTPSEVLQSY